MTGPARDARVLAEIEAEFREQDPQLLRLFDDLARGMGQQRRLGARWRRALACMLLIMLALAVLPPGGRWRVSPPVRAYTTLAGLASDATAGLLRWTAHGARDIRAQVCRSGSAGWRACG